MCLTLSAQTRWLTMSVCQSVVLYSNNSNQKLMGEEGADENEHRIWTGNIHTRMDFAFCFKIEYISISSDLKNSFFHPLNREKNAFTTRKSFPPECFARFKLSGTLLFGWKFFMMHKTHLFVIFSHFSVGAGAKLAAPTNFGCEMVCCCCCRWIAKHLKLFDWMIFRIVCSIWRDIFLVESVCVCTRQDFDVSTSDILLAQTCASFRIQ